MRDFIFRLAIILIVLLFESVVGLPILGFSLFLGWYKQSLLQFLSWFILVSLFIAMLWGVAWWFTSVILLVMTFLYDFLSKHVLNKLVKIVFLVLPAALAMAVYLNIDFNWRVVVYGAVSLLLLFIFQKFVLTNYGQKYL